jgi:transcriptional regulator with GAF, ATPase, and Fis domain
MATAGLIGCSPELGSLPGSFDQERLDLFDNDIISTSVFEQIVGSSGAICRVTAQVLRIAPSDATVLINGRRRYGEGTACPCDSQEVKPFALAFRL